MAQTARRETRFRRPEKRRSGLSSLYAAWGPHPHALSLAYAAFFRLSPTACSKGFRRERSVPTDSLMSPGSLSEFTACGPDARGTARRVLERAGSCIRV